MRRVAVVGATLLVCISSGIPAAETDPTGAPCISDEEILLWTGDAPGSENLQLQETLTERSSDPNRHDRIFTGVLRPSLEVHRPPAPNGSAVIVAPGGAYQRVVIDKEGRDIAEWLKRLGVTAFVLKYRLPGEGHAAPADAPLQDAQRAIRVLRGRAEVLGIDSQRIGIIGFSAGGHLAGSLAAHHDAKIYTPVDVSDGYSARPDFVILVYPVVGQDFVRPDVLARSPDLDLMISSYPLDRGISGEWPPTFLLHTGDDTSFPAEGSIRLILALRTAGVPAEIHLFQNGGHGFGIRNAEGPVAQWPTLCGAWMRSLGVFETQ